MGNPPEKNDTIANMVPRLEYNLKARQLQRIKFGEVLSTGGARYPLMEHKRDAGPCVEINRCVGCMAMTRPCWLRRAVRNRHRHAIEQASRRWRGGYDSTVSKRRKI